MSTYEAEQILEIFAGYMVFIQIASLISYVIGAIALMRIARKIAPDLTWMPWVPIINSFCIMKYCDRAKGTNFTGSFLKYFFLVIGLLFLSIIFAAFAPFLGLIGLLVTLGFEIAMLVVLIKSMHGLFSAFDPNNATLYTVLSIFIPLAQLIFLFIIGGMTPVSALYGQQGSQYQNYNQNNQYNNPYNNQPNNGQYNNQNPWGNQPNNQNNPSDPWGNQQNGQYNPYNNQQNNGQYQPNTQFNNQNQNDGSGNDNNDNNGYNF